MTIEQLGNLARNRYPNNPEYKGKSDREIGEMLTVRHYPYRGRTKVDFSKKEEPIVEGPKYPHMPKGYDPEGVVQYGKPIGPEPAPKKEPEKEPYTAKRAVTDVKDVGVGMNQEVAKMAFGLSSLGQKGLEYFVGGPTRWGLEKLGFGPSTPSPTATETFKDSEWLKSKNISQKIGQKIVEIGAFFTPIPVGKTAGFYKGMNIINKLKNPARTTKIVEKAIDIGAKVAAKPGVSKVVEKGAKFVSKPLTQRVITEGARFGGLTAIREGEIGKEAAGSAIIGGAFPVGGALIKSGASKLFSPVKGFVKDIPEKAWESILKRSPAEIQKTPTLAKDIAEFKITGKSREVIYRELSGRIIESNKLIDKMLAGKKAVLNVSSRDYPIVIDKYAKPQVMAESLKKLKETYAKIPGESASVNAVEKIIADISTKKMLTAPLAQEMKKQLYKMTSSSYNKGFLEIPAKKEAQKQLAKEIKKQLEFLAPGVKNENAREGILIGTRDAIEKAMGRAESKSPIGLTDILAGGMYLGGAGPSGIFAAIGLRATKHPMVLSGISKIIKYYETISPLKQVYYYETLKGLTVGYETLIRKK